MDKTGKTRKTLTLRIAGRFLTVATEEPEEEARRIEQQLNERMTALAKASPRLGTHEGRLDAALLLAVDAMGEADAAARRIDELEGELRRMRQAFSQPRPRAADPAPRFDGMSREEKLARIRTLLEAEKARAREARP